MLSTNPDYRSMDPKIQKLVRGINNLDIATFWSCEGHRDGRIIGSLTPKVAIKTENSSVEGLTKLFRLIGIFQKIDRETRWILVPHESHLSLEVEANGLPLEQLQSRSVELGKFLIKNAQRKF